MVRQCYFKLVLILLVLTPGIFPLTLLDSHLLVFSLDCSLQSLCPHGLLIFKHATHPEYGHLLFSPILLFLYLIGFELSLFAHLLISPVSLVLRILLHSLLIHCHKKSTCYSSTQSKTLNITTYINLLLRIIDSRRHARVSLILLCRLVA